MNLSTKLGYAAQHIESISRHDDENSSVRKEALQLLRNKIDEEEALIEAKDAERVSGLSIASLAVPEDQPKSKNHK